jgi:putative ABC transport system permease protein
VKSFWQDLSFAGRSFARSPGTPLLSMLTLGLAMALVTAQYAPIHKLLFRPLPFDATGRLVALRWNNPALERPLQPVRLHEYTELNRALASFESLTAYSLDKIGYSLRLNDGSWIERVGLSVFPNFLEQNRIRIEVGRGFTAEDFAANSAPVFILSRQLWEDLGRDPNIVGKTLYFDGLDRTIVGVAAPTFGVDAEPFWAPNTEDPARLSRDDTSRLLVLGVLRPGATLAQANAEVARVMDESSTLPADLRRRLGTLSVIEAKAALVNPKLVSFYWLMLVAVLLVLACACANVANLLLSRAAARRQELALRTSLGATRGRLVRQMLTESLLVALGGGLLGVGGAVILVDLAQLESQIMTVPSWLDYELSWGSVGAVLGLSTAATMIAALLPALRASSLELNAVLQDDARTSSGLHAGRTATVLVMLQLMLCVSVLIVAANAGIAIQERGERQPPIDPSSVLTTSLYFPRDEYPDPKQVRNLIMSFDRSLRDLPGGIRGALSSRNAFNRGLQASVRIQGRSPDPETQTAYYAYTGPGYFELLRAPVLDGRTFTESDTADSASVAVVDSTFAQKYWGRESPVGRTFQHGDGDRAKQLHVIGVVPSLFMGGITNEVPDAPGFYLPLSQMSEGRGLFPMLVGSASMEQLTSMLTDLIRAVRTDGTPTRKWTFQQEIDKQQHGLRVFTELFAVFGGCALVVSAMGLYGLMSLTVRQRVREIGTRCALGATPSNVLRMFLKRAVKQVARGTLVGLLVGTAMLGEIEERIGAIGSSSLAYVLVSVTLGAICVVATLVPAWRIAHMPPSLALRET